MKKLIIATLAALAFSGAAHADQCTDMATLATRIAEARDNGMAASTIMNSARLIDASEQAKASIINIVIAVYKFPELNPAQIGGETLKYCYSKRKGL